MDIKMLTPRNLNDGIKKGMTMGDFCEKYECSEEELTVQVGNLYSRNSSKAKEYISKIEANAKKARPKKVEPEAKEADEAATAETESAPDGLATTESIPSAEAVVSEQVAELEELKLSEVSLSREVMDLEAEHANFASYHKNCLAKLRDLRNDIARIKEEYDAKCEECDSLIQENNAYVEQMNDISAKLSNRRVVLDETRLKIAGLNKLIMEVYSAGEIYINDSRVDEGIELDEGLYKELRDRPECDELRQREIKTLAKMLTFTRGSTLTVEVSCENEDLEIAYLELA